MALAASGAPAQAEPVTIAALGDSLTQGYGLPQGDGLVPQLEAWLRAAGAEVTLINAGVSGDTTTGGLARIDWTLTPEVDALIVNLGGNDLLRGSDPDLARGNLDQILARATARGLPVLLIGLKAPGNYGPAYKADWDAMFAGLAQSHQTLLIEDFLAPLLLPTGGGNPDFVQPDGIHPNAAGVKILVEQMGPKALELIEAAQRQVKG